MMALAPRPASPGPGNGKAATQPKNQFAPEDEAPLLLDASALLRVFAAGVRLAVAQLATLPLRLRHGTPISELGLAAVQDTGHERCQRVPDRQLITHTPTPSAAVSAHPGPPVPQRQ